MKYLIQDSLYKEFHEERLIHTLNRMGLEYEMFSLQYFVDDIEVKTDRTDVMVFGAVKAAHLAKKYKWNPGSFYNENHDYIVYSKYYKENMLNWDSKIQKASDTIDIDGPFFARPTGDTKLFKGKAYENVEEWNNDASYFLTNNPNSKDELIQVDPLQNILQEIRCFIVKGKVITASMYKLGNVVLYKECMDDDIIEYANNMASIYQPADAFVMDICRTDNGVKIVECNCINCAGFYDIDMQKLIVSLEDNF